MKINIAYLFLKKYLILFFVGWIISSCGIKNNKTEPTLTFTRIYDNDSIGSDFSPLDIEQTSDGGYMILATYNGWNAYVMKVNATGIMEWEYLVPEDYVNPVTEMFSKNGSLYFFCMDKTTTGTRLLQIDEATRTVIATNTFISQFLYPLSVAKVPEGFLIHGYNPESKYTTLAKMDMNYTVQWYKEYDIGKEYEELIIGHVLRTRPRYPFFCGYVGTNASTYYYVNTLEAYNFNFLFIDPSSGNLVSRIFGFGSTAAMSSAISLSGNLFGFSRFYSGENFILPKVTVQPGTDISATQLPSNKQLELTRDAKVKLKKLNISGTEVIVYASSTKSNSIALLAYDAASGNLLGTKHLGHTSPYEPVEFIQTSDEGLAILAKTDVAGRFGRIAIFKLSKVELGALAGK